PASSIAVQHSIQTPRLTRVPTPRPPRYGPASRAPYPRTSMHETSTCATPSERNVATASTQSTSRLHVRRGGRRRGRTGAVVGHTGAGRSGERRGGEEARRGGSAGHGKRRRSGEVGGGGAETARGRG